MSMWTCLNRAVPCSTVQYEWPRCCVVAVWMTRPQWRVMHTVIHTEQWLREQWLCGQWLRGQWLRGQWLRGQWLCGPAD